MSLGWSPTGNCFNKYTLIDSNERYLIAGLFELMFTRVGTRGSERETYLTFVMPGRSTNVRFTTCGEKIFRWMGSSLIPWRKTNKKDDNSYRLILLKRLIMDYYADIKRSSSLSIDHFLFGNLFPLLWPHLEYLVNAGNPFCFCFDFLPDLFKVCVDL